METHQIQTNLHTRAQIRPVVQQRHRVDDYDSVSIFLAEEDAVHGLVRVFGSVQDSLDIGLLLDGILSHDRSLVACKLSSGSVKLQGET